MMKRISIICLIIVTFVPVFAKNNNEDAIFKLIHKSYTLNIDGSTDVRERKELQIFSLMTFDVFGETFIDYNPEFQSLTINEAYVLRKDGTKVETPQNAFNPMLPENCTNCERLNKIREMVVTHTALEPEAVIVLDYTIHSDNFFFKDLLYDVELCRSVPVEKFLLTISIPEDKPLSLNLNLNDVKFEKNQRVENGNRITEFMFSNLKSRSNDMYISEITNPSVSIASLNDKSNIVSQILNLQAFNSTLNDEIVDFFKSRFEKDFSNLDKVLYVKNFINIYISTKDIDPRLLNWVFASPNYVWSSNCALPVEKDILLRDILRKLGFDAQIAFVESSLSKTLQSVVKVIVDKRTIYTSANYLEELSLDALSKPAVFLFDDYSFLNLKPTDSDANFEISVTFDDQNIDNPVYTVSKSDVSSYLTNTLRPNEIISPRISFQQIGKYYKLSPMDGQYGTDLISVNINSNRKSNIKTQKSHEKYVYHISIPQNYKIFTDDYEILEEVEGIKMCIKMKRDGNNVTIERELFVPDAILPAKCSKKLKSLLAKWETSCYIIVK